MLVPSLVKAVKTVLKRFVDEDLTAFSQHKGCKGTPVFSLPSPSAIAFLPDVNGMSEIFKAPKLKADIG